MSSRIDEGARELVDAIIAALTLPPAAPHSWEQRRDLIADRALFIRGALGPAASPDTTLTDLASMVRQVDTAPLCTVTYEIARVDDEAVTP